MGFSRAYPSEKKPLKMLLEEDVLSPVCVLKYTNITQGYIYPTSSIPRFGITLVLEPCKDEHFEFLQKIEKLRAEIKGAGFLKPESTVVDGERCATGNYLLKMQGTTKPKPYVLNESKEPEEINLQDEVNGLTGQVKFSIYQYTVRETGQAALNFTPIEVCFDIESTPSCRKRPRFTAIGEGEEIIKEPVKTLLREHERLAEKAEQPKKKRGRPKKIQEDLEPEPKPLEVKPAPKAKKTTKTETKQTPKGLKIDPELAAKMREELKKKAKKKEK